jgi:Serine carboxypeptidase
MVSIHPIKRHASELSKLLITPNCQDERRTGLLVPRGFLAGERGIRTSCTLPRILAEPPIQPISWQYGQANATQNPFSWTNLGHMLWVDQPVGTGFSEGVPDIHVRDSVFAKIR